LLYLRGEQVSMPSIVYGEQGRRLEWKLPTYGSLHAVIGNPVYGGAYAYGKTEARVRVEAGRAHKTAGHRKPRDRWMVLLQGHHEGYIDWERYERNQQILAENNLLCSSESRKAGRGGQSLLSGLLRCGCCGRMLYTYYTGRKPGWCRYVCRGAKIMHGGEACISFSNRGPDEEVARAILGVVERRAIEAAVSAADQVARQQSQRCEALRLEVEQARYQAQLAARRHEAVDPAHRLVADELESRWNLALRQVQELEETWRRMKAPANPPSVNKERLLQLAQDMPRVWESCEDRTLKQRIARILIEEIIARIDHPANRVVLTIHWVGGRHSEVHVAKPKTGQNRHRTGPEAVEIVQQMAGRFPDEVIAATLNRLGLKTGAGNTWQKNRVCSFRQQRRLPGYDPSQAEAAGLLTAMEAAAKLGIDPRTVRTLIQQRVIPADQAVKFAPWQIRGEVLQNPSVLDRVRRIKTREGAPANRVSGDTRTLLLPGLDGPE
jgi:recombinase/recombinase-like zinc beta ribbon protein